MPKPLWADVDTGPAPLPAGWSLVATLRPASLGAVPQAAILMGNGDWVVSQDFDGANLVLSRFTNDGRRRGSMKVASGDHGDRLEARGDHDELVGLYVGGYPDGTWCELPWSAGHVWTSSEALKHRGSRKTVPWAARDWFQGEIVEVTTDGDDWTIRYYGVPFKDDGPSHDPQGKRNPNIPANLEFYRPGSSRIVKRERLDDHGRDHDGHPIGGRLEPEGLTVGQLRDQRVLLTGVAVGTIGDTYLLVYAKPI